MIGNTHAAIERTNLIVLPRLHVIEWAPSKDQQHATVSVTYLAEAAIEPHFSSLFFIFKLFIGGRRMIFHEIG
jgi:hypothetical protein